MLTNSIELPQNSARINTGTKDGLEWQHTFVFFSNGAISYGKLKARENSSEIGHGKREVRG